MIRNRGCINNSSILIFQVWRVLWLVGAALLVLGRELPHHPSVPPDLMALLAAVAHRECTNVDHKHFSTTLLGADDPQSPRSLPHVGCLSPIDPLIHRVCLLTVFAILIASDSLYLFFFCESFFFLLHVGVIREFACFVGRFFYVGPLFRKKRIFHFVHYFCS